jgi:hypothetical protein
VAKVVFVDVCSPCNRPLRPRQADEEQFHSFFKLGTRRGWVVNAMLWLLYLREGDPVLIVEDALWAFGPVWKGVDHLTPTRVQPSNCPAHSESLYQLCSPGSLSIYVAARLLVAC